jgi:hypothetical protein
VKAISVCTFCNSFCPSSFSKWLPHQTETSLPCDCRLSKGSSWAVLEPRLGAFSRGICEEN